ncbi:hypothetical protein [Rhizobium sp. Rhizsp82]|uniref:hypothetical protein n=1 Tax=Rhizobium sp. Rhizsp82 TaxID=3243057 RepID=UPI0039B55065
MAIYIISFALSFAVIIGLNFAFSAEGNWSIWLYMFAIVVGFQLIMRFVAPKIIRKYGKKREQ